jgi:hypothetical protein
MAITDAIEFVLSYPELGWILVMGYIAYELRGKRGRLYNLDKKLTSAIIVIRALARTDEDMDEQAVDEYLVENGMEPGDFIEEEDGDRDKASGGVLRSDGRGRFTVEEVIEDEEEDGEGQEFTSTD